jgi:hypothetical protein
MPGNPALKLCAGLLHLSLGIGALVYFGGLMWELLDDTPRIRPFSAIGFPREMLLLGASIAGLGTQVLLTQRLVGSLEFPAHIWTAALLGLVCSVAFMRYFTPALAVLSLASYFDAWVQSIPVGNTGRASVSRIASLVFTTVLLLGWIGFVVGGCLLVGV